MTAISPTQSSTALSNHGITEVNGQLKCSNFKIAFESLMSGKLTLEKETKIYQACKTEILHSSKAGQEQKNISSGLKAAAGVALGGIMILGLTNIISGENTKEPNKKKLPMTPQTYQLTPYLPIEPVFDFRPKR